MSIRMLKTPFLLADHGAFSTTGDAAALIPAAANRSLRVMDGPPGARPGILPHVLKRHPGRVLRVSVAT